VEKIETGKFFLKKKVIFKKMQNEKRRREMDGKNKINTAGRM